MQDTGPGHGLSNSGTSILTSGAGSTAKLAIVRQVLAEVCRELAQSLDPTAEAKLELTLDTLDIGKAGDVLSAHSESVATAVLRAERWDMTLLAGVDTGFVHSLIEVLFGGNGAGAPFRPERNLTRIELEVVKVVFRRLATALERGFAEVGATAFHMEESHSPPSYEAIGRPSTMVAVASIDLASVSGTGRLFVALPQSAFVFLKAAPPKKPAQPKMAVDPQWQQSLGNRLYGAEVSLMAVLGSKEMTLGEVSDFRPGQIIEMESVSSHRISLDCNGQSLFWCKLGQADGAYSLTIDDVISREQELMDDILPH